MLLLYLFLGLAGCEEREYILSDKSEKTVEVSLYINLADDADGYSLPQATATRIASDLPDDNTGLSGSNPSFAIKLIPSPQTKAGNAVAKKPDKLYNLEIQQYDRSGNRIGGMAADKVVDRTIGDRFTVTLAPAVDCQLVFVAWGSGNDIRLGTSATLSDIQKNKVIDASSIQPLDPAVQADMNKMPYVLHLQHVDVTADGTNGTIGNRSENNHDVRILLQRLATRLNLSWEYNVGGVVSDYRLNRILLQSVPLNYNVIAAPDIAENNTYPSLLDQFTTLSLTADEIARKSYSCWVPANVRGSNPAATSSLHRIKQNAPVGSSYATFIAVNEKNTKQKLDYRIYLGGKESSDFNLYAHTDYTYTVTFNHTHLPVNDRRVTIIDPIPASENNHNLVPTANCFMVVPGGAFCFNPLLFQQNGQAVTNDVLAGWGAAEGGITSVKLIWQTKENGDVGDPVMGVVNSTTDHTNIVDMKNGLIYCRVAPNTTGGSGLIAAYNSSGEILWSWHVWVTDYNPDPTGDETVLTPANKRKLKFTNHGSDQLPMMDRNLGAMAGYTLSDPPKNTLDMSKGNGFHYQWGRKDPFAGSYSAVSIDIISGLTSASIAPKGMLNRYGPDGISYLPLVTATERQTLRNTYKMPTDYILLSLAKYGWCAENIAVIQTLWNDAAGLKGMHDPCPAGWRVVSNSDFKSLAEGGSVSGNVTPNAANPTTAVADGGLYLYFQQNGAGEASYFRMPGYRRTTNTFEFIGLRSIIWMREYSAKGVDSYYSNGFDIYYAGNGNRQSFGITQSFSIQDGQVTRCIQERK